MQKYAAPGAKGGQSYNTYEDLENGGKRYEAPVEEPEMLVQK